MGEEAVASLFLSKYRDKKFKRANAISLSRDKILKIKDIAVLL